MKFPTLGDPGPGRSRVTQIDIQRCKSINLFGERQKRLLRFLVADAEAEILKYVLQEMQETLGEEMVEEDAVRVYLHDPERSTSLSSE